MATIAPPPVRILSIEQDRTLTDDLSEDDATFTRNYDVITNDTSEELNVFDIIDHDYTFRPGHRFNTNWKVNNLRLTESEANDIYRLEAEFIRVEYKTPFFVPIEWEWESTTLDLPAYSDNKGKAVVTTAGEPITGLTKPLKLWILKGTRNVPGVPKWFRNYGVSTNSDRVKMDGETFNPWELQMQRLSLGKWESETINKTEYRFRPLSFEFWFNPMTWRTEVLNMGFLELLVRRVFDPITKRYRYEQFQVRAQNANGPETNHRVFLDASGQRPRDQYRNIKHELDPSDIVTLKFDLLDELPYKPLLK